MKKRMGCILLLIVMFTSNITYAIDVKYENYDGSSIFMAQETDKMINITAEGAILMDAKTGAILYNKNIHQNYYPASITKIMTSIIVLENTKPTDIVTYSDNAINNLDPESSIAGINVGAKVSIKDSLYALLVVSANEAAAGMAEHVGGTQDRFAEMMTTKAKEIGCLHTTFKNPHGLFHKDHKTTAYDVALILRYAMQYDLFREIMATETYSLNKTETLENYLEFWNHSDIMRKDKRRYYMFAEGSKTGYISEAGNTLASYAKKGDMELICVVLKDKGEAIYDDTVKLFEYGFNNFEYRNALKNYDITKDETILKSSKNISDAVNRLDLIYNKEYIVMDSKNTKYNYSFSLDNDFDSGKLGNVKVFAGNQELTNVEIYYNKDLPSAKYYANICKMIDKDMVTFKTNAKRHISIRDIMFEIVVISILSIILIFAIFKAIRIIKIMRIKNQRGV